MRKITAGLLCFVLTFGLCTVSFAGEQGINAPDADSLIRNNEICMTLESTVSELSSLEADVDYVDGEGVFIADTKEEAEKVAAEYGATLKKYAHRVATISFGDSSIAAFGRAALSPVSKAVDPNYICHLSDVEEIPDIEETEEISPSVNRMEVKGTVPNDKYASSSEEDYQYFHEKINTLTAHDITTGSGVKIAVVDTGCTPDHEDSKFDTEHALAISGISSPADTAVGHGVHCTGIIHETKNNSLGGYGVAPGAEVYSIKIADSDMFDTSVAVEGMAIAIEKGVNVISMSLGGGHTESMKQLAEEAYERGITIVAAAGNECTSSTAAAFPAAYDTVISVAATDSSDALAEYSNYGDWVDIAAPGSDITSTFLHGSKNTISSGGTNETAYGRLSGTSMACPVTAGIVALMYAANPDLMAAQTSETVDAIREALLGTTDEKEYVYGDHSIKGLVQADKAVAAAKEAKVQVNKKYTLMNAAGTFGAHITGKIARGTTVQLSFGDLKGEKKDKSLKNALKSAKWSSSNPAVLTVKNGKVKCNKKASPGTKVTITAEADGDVMKCDYIVTERLIGAGYCVTTTNRKGKMKLKIRGKSNWTAYKDNNISLTDPSLNFKYTNLVFSKDSDDLKNSNWGYLADGKFEYIVTIKDKDIKKGNIEVKYSDKGKPIMATLKKAGKYTISYKTIEGSNVGFTCKITVK